MKIYCISMVANKLNKTQQRRIFALLKDLGVVESRAAFVPQFCDNRTDHVSELTPTEADAMIAGLEMYAKECQILTDFVRKKHTIETPKTTEGATEKVETRKYNKDVSADRMRRKILHILGLMGYLKPSGGFDYERINALIEGIGSNNPTKAKFNFLTNSELTAIVTQVEQRYKKTLKK